MNAYEGYAMTTRSLMNAEASEVVQGAGLGLSPFHEAGVTGVGQVVGCGDTGVDVRHCAFQQANKFVRMLVGVVLVLELRAIGWLDLLLYQPIPVDPCEGGVLLARGACGARRPAAGGAPLHRVVGARERGENPAALARAGRPSGGAARRSGALSCPLARHQQRCGRN